MGDYKGSWFARRIDNPDYKGEWKAKQVPNEDFVENVNGYDDIGAVGFELWTVNAGSIFDNILVTDSLDSAWEHAAAHWEKITEGEKEAKEAFDKAKEPEKEEDKEDVVDVGDDLDDDADLDEAEEDF